ncbi:hypothetical protein J6590_018875 [Homalodisca vitripennis]|nr:hypothetical protein J6590_018875 [Homalodisca vitripennis]
MSLKENTTCFHMGIVWQKLCSVKIVLCGDVQSEFTTSLVSSVCVVLCFLHVPVDKAQPTPISALLFYRWFNTQRFVSTKPQGLEEHIKQNRRFSYTCVFSQHITCLYDQLMKWSPGRRRGCGQLILYATPDYNFLYSHLGSDCEFI